MTTPTGPDLTDRRIATLTRAQRVPSRGGGSSTFPGLDKIGRQGVVSKGGRQRVGLNCDNIGKAVLLLHQYHVGIFTAFVFIFHLFTYLSRCIYHIAVRLG